MSTITYPSADGEIWKLVPGYDGRYEASSFGRVRRALSWDKYRKFDARRRPGELLSLFTDAVGYVRVSLADDGRTRRKGVHQVVAAAFWGPCPENHEVNHIDGNKSNNQPDNLEYVTHQQNLRHFHNKHIHTTNSKLTTDDVRDIKRLLLCGISGYKIAEQFGVSTMAISNIRNGKTWQHVHEAVVSGVQLPLFEE